MKRLLSKYLVPGLIVLLILSVPFWVFLVEGSHLRSAQTLSVRESKKHTDGGFLADQAVIDRFAELEYRYTGGRYENEAIRYRFRSPKKIVPGRTYPLVVWLHGKGESGEDNTRQLAHLQGTMEFLDGKNELDFFILATQCPADNREWERSVSPDGKGDAPVTILGEILDEALKKYPVDRNRIGVIGVCSGGSGAWPLLKSRPDLFSGAVVFSTAAPTDFQWDERFRNTAFWAFANRDDRSVSIPEMRYFVDRINRSGGLAHLTLRKTGGHDSWSNAMREDKVVAWLVRRDRQQRSPPPGLAPNVYDDWKKPGLYFVLPLVLIGAVGFVRVRQWIDY